MSERSDRRQAAVAGLFYPGDPASLRALVDECLAGVPTEHRSCRAAIVPHAALIYSGRCAGAVLGRLDIPPIVVIVAPNHRGRGHAPAALWSSGAFDTSIGACVIDDPFAHALEDACDLARHDPSAHRHEHSIEVEIPFLRVLAPDSHIVPLLLAFDRWDWCAVLAEALARVVAATTERVLLMASSDMTHYEPANSALAKDRQALSRIEKLDGRELLDVCRREDITMCGRAPVAVVIEAARRLGATSAEVVDHRHSGLVTGDDSSVVSYAGAVID